MGNERSEGGGGDTALTPCCDSERADLECSKIVESRILFESTGLTLFLAE